MTDVLELSDYNLQTSAEDRYDAITLGILESAQSEFESVGLRRSSMARIASAAGVSRVTLYRRFANRDQLINAVFLKVLQQILSDAQSILGQTGPLPDRLQKTVVALIRHAREHPLITTLLSTEPENTLPFLTINAQPLINLAQSYTRQWIVDAQKADLIKPYDPAPVAELLVRLTQSTVVSPHSGSYLNSDHGSAEFARQIIVPLIINGPPGAQGNHD